MIGMVMNKPGKFRHWGRKNKEKAERVDSNQELGFRRQDSVVRIQVTFSGSKEHVIIKLPLWSLFRIYIRRFVGLSIVRSQ
jgi:hypothetical protein